MRRTLDRLISIGGLILAVVLLAGGGLLLWGSTFITSQVHDQLAAQRITMPTEETGLAELPPDDKTALEPYAGEQMTTGNQAHAYADHYIAVHLDGVADGKTYSQVSGEWLAASCTDPTAAESAECQTLTSQRATLFQGETLRGLLLTSYAFSTMGTYALYGAIVAFVAAAVLLVLVFLGFRRARRGQEGQPAA